MLELISIVCSLFICVLTPIEMGKIRNGWTGKKFDGDREKFLAAYRNQLAMLMWLGLVFGALNIVLALIESNPGERVVKLVAGAIWFVVSVITYTSRRGLPEAA